MSISALRPVRSHRRLPVPFGRSEAPHGLRRFLAILSCLSRTLIGLWLCARLFGCAAPADPAAFATATDSLARSVRALGSETRERLAAAPDTHSKASEFERHWSARNRAMAAASSYGHSLVATFARAHSAQPDSLARNLQLLARSVGIGGAIDTPQDRSGMEVGGTALGSAAAQGVLVASVDTIAFICAQIELVRASRDLEEALTRSP